MFFTTTEIQECKVGFGRSLDSSHSVMFRRESLWEPARRKVNVVKRTFLKPSKEVVLGTWNVRTMGLNGTLIPDKTLQLTNVLKKYKVDVAGLCETR